MLPSNANAATSDTVPGFAATYDVRYGILRGTMTLELAREDSSYVYETALQPRGFASWLRRGEVRENTTIDLADGSVRPKRYTNTDTIAKPSRYAYYDFDPVSGRVTGEYKAQAVDEQMRTGGQSRISVQVAIMHALRSGTTITEVPVFDRGRWRDFHFDILPEQTVATPSGSFDALEIRYASTKKEKSWSLYCAESLDYLPVMNVYREGEKTKSRAVLTDYRIDNQAAP